MHQQQNIVTFTELKEYPNGERINKTIKATVLIKSEIRTWGWQQGRTETFFIDLRDDSGEMISAVSETDAGTTILFPIIKKNTTYDITGFILKNTRPEFTSIPHPKWIYLMQDTKVTEIATTSESCDLWPLTDLKEVNNLSEGDFVNIVGVYTACEEMKGPYKNGKYLQKAILEDGTGQATLATWVEETSILRKLGHESVIFVKDARKDDEVLNTTRFIEVLAPEDPRALMVKDAYLEKKRKP